MGVFGAPVSHGDDPERAVRAALGIRDCIAELNEQHRDLDLQVRIAVNTGEAIARWMLDAAQGEGFRRRRCRQHGLAAAGPRAR